MSVLVVHILFRLIDGVTLDVLVNNAGVSPPNSSDRTMNPYNEDWELSMSVNCIAPVLLTDLLMDELKQCALNKVCRLMCILTVLYNLACHDR